MTVGAGAPGTPVLVHDVTASLAAQGELLGIVHYGERAAAASVTDGRLDLRLHMARCPEEQFAEVWFATGPVRAGMFRGLAYAHDGEHLLCAAHVPPGQPLTAPVRERYRAMFALLSELGFPEIVRIWNAMSQINATSPAGLETYRDFCRGRAEAFDASGIPDAAMPAATGIGAVAGGVGLYLLACRSALRINIENPQQTPAYRYPRRYGPRSPSFARATYVAPSDRSTALGRIYVSGTASIVGHASVHEGDVVRQCETALENIERLLSKENLARHGIDHPGGLAGLDQVKVYVRHREHFAVVRRICEDALPSAHLRLLNVDICRGELLVEIEGVVPELAS